MSYASCSKCNINGTDTTTTQGKSTNFKKQKHTASTQQIFLAGIFLHSPNFSLLGKQEPQVNE